jgi:hypothetical protein
LRYEYSNYASQVAPDDDTSRNDLVKAEWCRHTKVVLVLNGEAIEDVKRER